VSTEPKQPAEKADDEPVVAEVEERRTRRLATNENVTRQTRRLATNENVTRQTRRLASNHNLTPHTS
jgi:hypothetical protein